MRKLFLDDERKPPDFTWDVVRNYEQFLAYIQLHGVPDVISFDHDLGQEHYDAYEAETLHHIATHPDGYNHFTEKTGYDCAKWLIKNHKLPSQYLVHSQNPVGAANIRFVMDAGYRRLNEVKETCNETQNAT